MKEYEANKVFAEPKEETTRFAQLAGEEGSVVYAPLPAISTIVFYSPQWVDSRSLTNFTLIFPAS